MNRTLGTLAALVLTLTLAACSGDDTPVKADSPTPSPAPVTTTPAAPKVSDVTTCQVLFPATRKGSMSKINVMLKGPINRLQADRIETAITELRQAGETAQPDLEAQITALADQASLFLEDANAGTGVARDVSLYKVAGLEITNTCIPLL